MKLKGILLTSALTTMLGIGVFAGVSGNKGTAPVEKAEAAGTTFYFVPNDNWVKDSASFKIDFRDSSGGWLNKRESMIKESYKTKDNKAVYSYTVSSMEGIGSVYFGRFSADGGTQHNYSGKCSINSSVGYYYIDGSSNWDDQVISPSDRLPDRIVVGSTTPSLSTGRVIINNYGSGWTDGNVGVRCWGGDATATSPNKYDATIYCTEWIKDKADDDATYYGYVDIPTNVTAFQFVKLSAKSTSATIWNYQNGSAYSINANCFAKVYYISNGYSSGADISIGGAKNDKAYSNLLSKVIEAYDTCENNALNGYAAYSSLNTYFFSHAVAGQTSASVTSLNGLSDTIANHISGMKTRSGAKSSGALTNLPVETTSTTTTVMATVVTTVIAISTAAGFLFLKKKKNF